jgi:hypothetical protein
MEAVVDEHDFISAPPYITFVAARSAEWMGNNFVSGWTEILV